MFCVPFELFFRIFGPLATVMSAARRLNELRQHSCIFCSYRTTVRVHGPVNLGNGGSYSLWSKRLRRRVHSALNQVRFFKSKTKTGVFLSRMRVCRFKVFIFKKSQGGLWMIIFLFIQSFLLPFTVHQRTFQFLNTGQLTYKNTHIIHLGGFNKIKN